MQIGRSVCLALALSTTPALAADPPSSEASVETRRDLAKAKFQRGSELYEAGNYGKAVQAFMEADKLAPSAALSFNIARAYERLNDTSGALRWYRDYLRRSPAAQNAAEVRAQVSTMSAKLAKSGLQQLTVLSMPVGAVVMIDGRAVGVTPFTSDLALGKHRVSLRHPGHREASHDVSLTPSGPGELSANLEQEQAPATTPSPMPVSTDPRPNRDDGRRFGVAPWLIAGAGVASLAGALGFELARRAHEDSAEGAPDQPTFKEKTDAMERDKTTARVLAGVGGALVVTGSVMLFLNRQTSDSSAPRVAFGCTYSGCTASARGSF